MTATLVKLSDHSTNCATWSPDQAVEQFLQEMRDGKVTPVKLMILFFEETADHALKPRRWFVNISRTEEVALTVLATQMAIEEWKD